MLAKIPAINVRLTWDVKFEFVVLFTSRRAFPESELLEILDGMSDDYSHVAKGKLKLKTDGSGDMKKKNKKRKREKEKLKSNAEHTIRDEMTQDQAAATGGRTDGPSSSSVARRTLTKAELAFKQMQEKTVGDLLEELPEGQSFILDVHFIYSKRNGSWKRLRRPTNRGWRSLISTWTASQNTTTSPKYRGPSRGGGQREEVVHVHLIRINFILSLYITIEY